LDFQLVFVDVSKEFFKGISKFVIILSIEKEKGDWFFLRRLLWKREGRFFHEGWLEVGVGYWIV